jgi:hypothetical protein
MRHCENTFPISVIAKGEYAHLVWVVYNTKTGEEYGYYPTSTTAHIQAKKKYQSLFPDS